MTARQLHPAGAVYGVDLDFDRDPRRRELPRRDVSQSPRTDIFMDVAVVELDDGGGFADRRQLSATTRHITRLRDEPGGNGVLVVLFIHGWRHNARWHDEHFRGFRDVLAFLAGRESERLGNNPQGRHVVGVYVGWDGKARRTLRGSILGRVGVDHPTFFNRYETALRIGQGKDMRELVRRVTDCTKRRGGAPSQLILMGHSMGGLILESTLLETIRRGGKTLLAPPTVKQRPPLRTSVGGSAVVFPDAVITLNSAADYDVAKTLRDLMTVRRVKRRASDGPIGYSPPLLISATSTADTATGTWWPTAMELLRSWRRRFGRPADDSLIRNFRAGEILATVGHHGSLLTHDLVAGRAGGARCRPGKAGGDLGQEFHCLRRPKPLRAGTPRLRVALPERQRTPGDKNDKGTHTEYRLEPRGDTREALLLWNFQVPAHLIRNHNDIFDFRARALILALMQISGAIASLALRWRDSFEDG